MSRNALDTVVEYHDGTKHFPNRSAPGPGFMDWATQPDPFRRFDKARTIPLAVTTATTHPCYDDLYEPRAVATQKVTRTTFSSFLQYALGLSAWKEYQGSRWALRMNPSSGNLHPTEGYVIADAIPNLTEQPGVFHYAPKDHLIECRRTMTANEWNALAVGLPEGAFLVGLTSIHWRESWKYGERAFRYCQHDAGHAIAALSLSAALLGWRVSPLPTLGDRRLDALLGLNRVADFEGAEEEHPDLMLIVTPGSITADDERSIATDNEPSIITNDETSNSTNDGPSTNTDDETSNTTNDEPSTNTDDETSNTTNDEPSIITDGAVAEAVAGTWHGQANALSKGHTDWPMIDEVADACQKPDDATLFRAATVRERSVFQDIEGLRDRGIKVSRDKGTEQLDNRAGRGRSADHRDNRNNSSSEDERSAAQAEAGGSGASDQLPPAVAGGPSEALQLPPSVEGGSRAVLQAHRPQLSAYAIIAQRRSAVSMNESTSISADAFYLMMDRTMPRYDRAPWRALGPPAYVHLGLFVHLVEGLEPGLYLLIRGEERERTLRDRLHSEFVWEKPPDCPAHLPLYRMMSGDARRVAGQISCGQQIAAGGAFSLGMIAEFEQPLREHGPWLYRRLFWETGVIGQVLYLEAEAAGVRATGIGCFFDDAMHELFGIKNRSYQSLYHFTVGGAVDDSRLTTLPAYGEDVMNRE